MAGAGGGLQMDTEATTQAMTRLAAAGSALDAGWSSANASIMSMEGSLGQGRLGQAFMAGYRPAAGAARDGIAQCIPVPGRLADAGHQAVGDYQQADARGRAGLAGAGHGPA